MWDVIALDLDGTLLDDGKRIASETLDVLRDYVQQGTWITIATGRGFPDTHRFMLENGLGPEAGFPQSLICEERDLYWLRGSDYVEDDSWNRVLKELETSALPEIRRCTAAYGRRAPFYVNSEWAQERRGFVELVFGTVDQAAEFCEEASLNGSWPPGFRAVRNHRGVTFRHETVGKGAVLTELLRRLDVRPEQVLAMGDSHNDLDMLVCGVRPATTANADDLIKETVRSLGGYVSRDATSLGVADALRSFHA